MKRYEQFINDNKPNVIFYKDNSGYEPIFAYDGKNVLGYITPGYTSEKHEAEKLINVGTIWRDINAPRGLGNILYKLFIRENGKVIPSDNISDNAKKMFKKLYDDSTIINTKYDNEYRYKEEDYLNVIMTLSQSESNKLPELKENTDQKLSQHVEEVINKTKDEIFENEATNYTIGQSKVRDELMMKTGKYKSIQEIPYDNKI
jgi:hypothetical protein